MGCGRFPRFTQSGSSPVFHLSGKIITHTVAITKHDLEQGVQDYCLPFRSIAPYNARSDHFILY